MKTMARRPVAAAVLVLVLSAALAFCQQGRDAKAPRAVSVDQGCVNQGSDRREFALLVCWLQRHLSWKSEREPYFTSIGEAQGTHLGLAWPPYLVFNLPDGSGRWRVFRIGFRYDRTWRGYIFPTLAAKRLSHPLTY